ncbi:MAG TPA: cell division protein FtsA [Candidatus Paceibacterota bacterium]|nr:cell division protein FtsA [Candidatus Paceibacterota bacterium]
MSKIVACGIDIGTHQIKVMACERSVEDGRHVPRIIGTGFSESRGLRHGYIVNVQEITHGIREAIAQIQKHADVEIKKAFLGIGGVGLTSLVHQGSIMISRADGEITDLDVEKVLKVCEETLPSHHTINKRILHTIPISYKVDGKVILSRPQGLKGAKLEARVLFVSCVDQHLNDLVEALNNAGLEVEDVMASPLAASLVTLTKAQKIAGCVLANIGAETASIVVFENSVPISLEVFPIGGIDITHDIALGMRIPIDEAESIKRGKKEHNFPKKKLDDIIAARLTDIFELIEAHLKKIGKSGLLPAGVVLTGGSSGVTSIEDIARATLKLPARTAKSINIKNEKTVQDSFWSVAYGLCLFGINHESAESLGMRVFEPIRKGFIEWIRQFLP